MNSTHDRAVTRRSPTSEPRPRHRPILALSACRAGARSARGHWSASASPTPGQLRLAARPDRRRLERPRRLVGRSGRRPNRGLRGALHAARRPPIQRGAGRARANRRPRSRRGSRAIAGSRPDLDLRGHGPSSRSRSGARRSRSRAARFVPTAGSPRRSGGRRPSAPSAPPCRTTRPARRAMPSRGPERWVDRAVLPRRPGSQADRPGRRGPRYGRARGGGPVGPAASSAPPRRRSCACRRATTRAGSPPGIGGRSGRWRPRLAAGYPSLPVLPPRFRSGARRLSRCVVRNAGSGTRWTAAPDRYTAANLGPVDYAKSFHWTRRLGCPRPPSTSSGARPTSASRSRSRRIPPFLMLAIRFADRGAVLLLAWEIVRGDLLRARPTRRQVRDAAIVGALLLGIGNGFVALAELTVAVRDRRRPDRADAGLARRPRLGLLPRSPPASSWSGIALGMAGVALLVWPPRAACVRARRRSSRSSSAPSAGPTGPSSRPMRPTCPPAH